MITRALLSLIRPSIAVCEGRKLTRNEKYNKPVNPPITESSSKNPYTFRRRRLSNVVSYRRKSTGGQKNDTKRLGSQSEIAYFASANRFDPLKDFQNVCYGQQEAYRKNFGMFSCPGAEPILYYDADGDGNENITIVKKQKINQDRGGSSINVTSKYALFGVFDGHGVMGDDVAEFALLSIFHEFQKRFACLSGNLKQCFCEIFFNVDKGLELNKFIDSYSSGSTAVCALLSKDSITTASVGDSRCVLARKLNDGTFEAIDLTIDHNPDTKGEYDRIVKSGGFVSTPSEEGFSARVWLDCTCTEGVGLAMARSLGDHILRGFGVISTPEVRTHKINLDKKDSFIVLASDGVWEFISSDEAVNIIGAHLDRSGASSACEYLVRAAIEKWTESEGDYRDDITAIVVDIRRPFWRENNTSDKPSND